MKRNKSLIAFIIFSLCFLPVTSFAQECFIGEVRWFAGNFAPRSWAFAHGQLLPINQNQALFSILGTTYGGDGRTTFALPDLRGRVAVGTGSGPGLTSRREGEKFGSETNTLSVNQLPSHTHSLNAEAGGAVDSDPEGKLLSKSGTYRPKNTGDGTTLHSSSIGSTGGGQPVNNLPPSLALNPIICLYGIFPSRS